MHLLSVVGIGLAANLDNLGIGMSFGSRSTRIPLGSNLIIAAMSMIAAYVSITCGEAIATFVPGRIAGLSGGLLLAIMGLWSLISERSKRLKAAARTSADTYELSDAVGAGPVGTARWDAADGEAGSVLDVAGVGRSTRPGSSHVIRNPEAADVDGNHVISLLESFALGGALSINCIASGLGAGVSGLSPLALTLSVGLFSLLSIAAGTIVGSRLAGSWFGRRAGEFGSLLLLLVGVYELLV